MVFFVRIKYTTLTVVVQTASEERSRFNDKDRRPRFPYPTTEPLREHLGTRSPPPRPRPRPRPRPQPQRPAAPSAPAETAETNPLCLASVWPNRTLIEQVLEYYPHPLPEQRKTYAFFVGKYGQDAVRMWKHVVLVSTV